MAFNDAAWAHDGLTYDADDMRTLVASLAGTVSGVVGDVNAAKVTQQTSAADTVKVAVGSLVIDATGAGLLGSYHDHNDASLTSPVISPTSANGRKDRLIARVTAGVTALEVVEGVASGSPAEPSITGDNYLELALITLPASTTNITDAMITDRRVRVDNLQDLRAMVSPGAWTTYVPALTQNGTTITKSATVASYTKWGRTVMGSVMLQATGAGTTGAGVLVGLPVAAVSNAGAPVGSGSVYDSSTGGEMVGIALLSTSTTVSIRQLHTSAIDDIGTTFAIGANDFIRVMFVYQAAA